MRAILLAAPLLAACSSQLDAASPSEPPDRCAYVRAIAEDPWPLELGLREWLGDGVPRDPAAGRKTLDRACNEGTIAACTALAVLAGEDVVDHEAHDVFDFGGCEEAAPTTTEGITSGMTACCRGARGCPSGCDADCARTAATIRLRTIDVLERGCAGGSSRACHLAGLQYRYGAYFEPIGYVVQGDRDRAHRLFVRACDGGVARACTYAGGDARLRRACDLGDGYGCLELARAHEGTREARSLQVRACKLGMQLVCEDLARAP